jgi:outer membrane receptor protein involved in Fe transport
MIGALQIMVPVSLAWGQSVEEIVVTTRRKEENLQEVPIAVTAIGADAIERQGLTDMFKLADIDPSVAFDTSYGPSDTRVAIRGLSNTRGRSNVAFLVDGVDVTSENQIAAGSGLLANQRLLSDVERIEIVKGPQNALYGRAAFAGAIAYTTKNPTDTLTGNIGIDYAEGNEYQIKGAVSGPINDALGFRLDALSWSSDGRYNNSISGSDLGGGDGWGGSGTLRWEPSDSFDVKARIAYSEDNNTPRPVVLLPGDTFAAYPDSMIEAGIGVGGPFFEGGGQELGLVNHGTYCPDVGVWNDGNELDPDFDNTLPGVLPGTPGICTAGNFGSISDLPNGKNSITHSETVYGKEQPGYTLDMFRSSLTANWDIDAGTIAFIGGYTNADQSDMHDQDFQAYERPDRLGLNDPYLDYGDSLNIGNQQADTETDTRLFSGELRFSTDFEGPVNGTVGYLYWDLKVDTEDRNYIASCMKSTVDFDPGTENVFTDLPTVSDITITNNCDGGIATTIGSGLVRGETVDNWQEYMDQFLVRGSTVGVDSRTSLVPGRIPGAPWVSDTDHQSIYTQLEWDIADTLTLTGEARWVDEEFSITRPNQASCGNISTGFGRPDGTTALSVWHKEGTGNVPDLNCSSVTGEGTFDDWEVIEGSESDTFIAPKATLEWFISDKDMTYFSWAKAQKPGGINQLAAGGSSTEIDELRFDAEKMTTWELGAKTSWELAGTLIANGALFFNDYTDKQVATQEIDEFGTLQPRVENAAAAEVKGMEVDLNWFPSFVEGFNLRLAYTYQDAEYTDYIEETQSAPRAAANGSCNVVDATGNGDLFCALDLNGKALERQAKNAFSGNFAYVRPFAGTTAEWYLEGDAIYTDKRYLDQDNFQYFDSYWLFNFRVGTQTDKWDVTVFLDNAFDDDTIRTGGSGPDFGLQNTRLGFIGGLGVNGYFGILPNPRTLGVRTNYRFGS